MAYRDIDFEVVPTQIDQYDSDMVDIFQTIFISEIPTMFITGIEVNFKDGSVVNLKKTEIEHPLPIRKKRKSKATSNIKLIRVYVDLYLLEDIVDKNVDELFLGKIERIF